MLQNLLKSIRLNIAGFLYKKALILKEKIKPGIALLYRRPGKYTGLLYKRALISKYDI